MNRTYTANDICRAINALDKHRHYGYHSGEIRIVSVAMPEGPIRIQRRTSPAEKFKPAVPISAQMLGRAARALESGLPVNLDRVLGASYNTRSVLESLLAHTPEIYTCHPGRQEMVGGRIKVRRGHKHIILCDEPHPAGAIAERDLGEDYVICEVPSINMMYDVVPAPHARDEIKDLNVRRKHSQMQIALAEIARALDMRTWLAVEDHGIRYNGKPILEYPFIVANLEKERVISEFPEAIKEARHIDCMYFNGGLPFAFEVEHTTGVTSGLTRMLKFRDKASFLNTRYVVVAPDDDRSAVMRKAQPEQFDDLSPLFFPYSQVEELYAFVSRHYGKLRGVKKDDFLLNFMEPCRCSA